MALSSLAILFILFLGHFYQPFSLPLTDPPFIAGVVEFSPHLGNGTSSISRNLLGFNDLAAEAKARGVQILLFPEDAIIGYEYRTRVDMYPYLEELPPITHSMAVIVPCKNPEYADRPIFQSLSCMALRYEMVIVANMAEKQLCNALDPHCPSDGLYIYNTNSVFEKDGSFVTKYRKVYQYVDDIGLYDVPPSEDVMFTASFGVTFGSFTCLDILFSDPALTLVERGVRNILFPTAWGSQLPYFVSVAIQQAWSRKTGTTLLAANFHLPADPELPSTGSGIYSSGVPLSTFISGEAFAPATGRLIVAELPKGPGMGQVIENPEGVGLVWAKNHVFRILSGTSPLSISYTEPAVNTTLTCSLTYTYAKHFSNETYGLGVLIRKRKNEYNGGCSLVKCKDASCSDTSFQPTIEASTMFSYISLSGDFPIGSTVFFDAVGNHFKLLQPEQLHFESNTLTVKDPPDPLISVSLWSILPFQVKGNNEYD